MLVAIGLLVLAGDTVSGKLLGQNVCQEEKRYTINVTEYFVRNSTVRRYQWCMNVPPRCSFYTTRLINDSHIVEKEVADLIDICCSGYVEDNGRCKPVCPVCNNGTCLDGKCACFAGYKGEYCEKDCGPFEWGENCKLKCQCHNGPCHPQTGTCLCPPGFTGSSCTLSCPSGFFGLGCQGKCPCDLCDHTTGHCETISTSTSTLQTISLKNNGRFEISMFSTDEPKISNMPLDNYVSAQSNDDKRAGPSVDMTKSKSKAKVGEKEVNVVASEENYFDDDTTRGNPEVNRSDLVSSASAATAISVGIIIVAAVIVAGNHLKSRRKKSKEGKNGVSTVAVYTHSIFHTPLPEPPTFESPIFTHSETNASNEGRFETHVVCSMNFPSHTPTKDPREYLYDHPPSTGSYRAASIPEPLDFELGPVHSEPLYDEIPSGVTPTPVTQGPPSYKSGSLYMNTCGKTRF